MLYCIYHNRDLDGYCSGAIVKYRYPEAQLIGFDYQDDVEQLFAKIKPNSKVIMVDVSLKMPLMKRLSDHVGGVENFMWIDHHISAIKEFQAYEKEIGEDFVNYRLFSDIAACEITWRELFPDRPVPISVQLLGEYDTWRNHNITRWESMILPFQFGMRLECNSPETFNKYLFEDIHAMPYAIIESGNTILKYQSRINETQCKKAAFEYEFEGYTAICLNGGGFNSDVFKSVYDERKHDIMMPFQFNGNLWTVSLYTTKDHIDVSVLAKNRGGGGHKKAAGFQVKRIEDLFSNLV